MDEAIITTSWDDGHPLDLKLAQVLLKYDVPATFYIPIDYVGRQNMNSKEIREIAQCFDIGGHTYHHTRLTQVSLKDAERDIIEGKKRLEEIIDRELLCFAYPYGEFNDRIINLVRQAGFIGGRTMQLFRTRIRAPFKMGITIYAAGISSATYVKHTMISRDKSFRYALLKNSLFGRSWNNIAAKTLDLVIENGGIWHLQGHSWEIDNNNEWKQLEDLLYQTSIAANQARTMNNSQLIHEILTEHCKIDKDENS